MLKDGSTPTLVEQTRRVAGQTIACQVQQYGSLENAAEHETWHWGSGVLMFGLLRAHGTTQQENILLYLTHWIDHNIEKGIHLAHTDRIMPAGVVGSMLMNGQLDSRYAQVISQAHDYLIEGKRKVKGCEGTKIQLQWRGRSWLDDLFMTGILMIRYKDYFKVDAMNEMIAAHFLAHLDLLQCHADSSKVLNHGQWLLPNGTPYLPDGNIAWSRANGWYLVAMADFLTHTPTDSPHYPVLVQKYQEIIAEVITYQGENGLFPTVMDHPDTYGEVAATGLFVHATAAGLKNGWLTEDQYYRTLHLGLTALYKNIDQYGRVGGVSAGTPVMPGPGWYNKINVGTYPWGDGAVLLALTEANALLQQLTAPTASQAPLGSEKERFLRNFN